MRTIIFLSAFSVLFVLAFGRPFISLSLWLWSGLVVPKYWLYGFAESISYNSIFALITLASYIFYKKKPSFKMDKVFILVILFYLHTTLTSFLSIGNSTPVWSSWNNFSKVILLFLFTCLIIRKKHQFDFIAWGLVLSVGFFGFVEGVKFILSGGGHHITGPSGHILADNNHFAAALSMTLPLMIYLISFTSEKIIKVGLICMLTVCILAVLGTHSRGGLIGLSVLGGYFWLKSNHKFVSVIVILLVMFAASSYLPDSWFDRMNTIETMDQDSSFMTRVNSWKMHTIMALNHPFIGGGFKALEQSYIWNEMAADIDILDFIPSPEVSTRGWAAHSIYFQVLGDHGFIGLFLFLYIILTAFLKLGSIEKHYKEKDNQDSWQYALAKMLKLSLIAYAICGAALSLAYVEVLYAILAIIICLSLQKESEGDETEEDINDEGEINPYNKF